MNNLRIDNKKLKTRDRELLLKLSFDRAVVNSTSRLINTTIFIALASFLISIFSLVKDTVSLNIMIFLAIFILGGFVFYLVMLIKAQRIIEGKEIHYANNFKTLFNDHFSYAVKRR